MPDRLERSQCPEVRSQQLVDDQTVRFVQTMGFPST